MRIRVGDPRGLELGSEGEMQDRLNALIGAGDKRHRGYRAGEGIAVGVVTH